MIGWDYIAQSDLFLIYILCAMRDITKDYLAGYNSWIKIEKYPSNIRCIDFAELCMNVYIIRPATSRFSLTDGAFARFLKTVGSNF